MDREEYQLFERRPDGSLNSRGLVCGLQRAHVTLSALSHQTNNDYFAMDSTGGEIVLARTPLRSARRIFQIAYGKALLARAQLLRQHGYDVTSVCGNRAARLLLRRCVPYDLVVLGDAPAEPMRRELVSWLRARHPNARIVALNRPGQALSELCDNAPNEPEAAWVPVISTAMAHFFG